MPHPLRLNQLAIVISCIHSAMMKQRPCKIQRHGGHHKWKTIRCSANFVIPPIWFLKAAFRFRSLSYRSCFGWVLVGWIQSLYCGSHLLFNSCETNNSIEAENNIMAFKVDEIENMGLSAEQAGLEKKRTMEYVKLLLPKHGVVVDAYRAIYCHSRELMFRVMFNSVFVQSNTLVLGREEIYVVWNVKDQFPKDFKIEFLQSMPVLVNCKEDMTADIGVRLLGGGLCGITAASVTYQLDLVRTRLAAQGVGPNIAIGFSVYETLRSYWQLRRPCDSAILVSLACGSLSGIA